SDLDLGRDAVALLAELDDRPVHRLLRAIKVPNEVGYPPGILIPGFPRLVLTLVRDGNGQVPVEEGHLLEPAGQRLEVPVGGLEDVAVRPERDRGAAIRGLGSPLERAHRGPAVVGLGPDVAVPVDLDLEQGRQGVHHGHADAVQAAGDRVRLAVELAARVQRGHDELNRRAVLDRVLVHGDAAAVVAYPDAAVGQQRDLDGVAVAGQGLVHRVIYDLVDEVMQSSRTGRAGVHSRTLADGLKTLEYRDRACIVGQTELHPA